MTPQHHIIKESSDSISRLLQEEYKQAGYKRVHIIDEAPKPDAVEGKLPAVSVYLYQVSLDFEGLEGHVANEIFEAPDEKGEMREWARRRRTWIRCDYLISTWAQTPEDEQILLGLAIRMVMENHSIPREKLRGETFDDDFQLWLKMSQRLDEGTLSRFWGGLSQPVRPAIQVWTSLPIIASEKKPLTRVRERALNYRDINHPPGVGTEAGPTREVLSRRDFEP